MIVGVLITDNGAHPPEKWAEVTADQIIQIAETADETRVAEAKRFRAQLVDILTGQHDMVQEHERGKLDEHGYARLCHNLEPESHIEAPIAEIVEAAKAYSFGQHFQSPETQSYLRSVLASHFATAMHIERSLYADANPEALEVKTLGAAHHPEE